MLQAGIWWQQGCSELFHFVKQKNRKNALLSYLKHMTCSSEHWKQKHLLLEKVILQNQITGFILCLMWMITKRLIAFIYTTNQLHWNHLMFRFSLQHCFKDCEGNTKLTSKPSAHQHFISFALISSHIGKLSSCLSKYMDIWDSKHARICDSLSAAKKIPVHITWLNLILLCNREPTWTGRFRSWVLY